jgi:hypothetical protein
MGGSHGAKETLIQYESLVFLLPDLQVELFSVHFRAGRHRVHSHGHLEKFGTSGTTEALVISDFRGSSMGFGAPEDPLTYGTAFAALFPRHNEGGRLELLS